MCMCIRVCMCMYYSTAPSVKLPVSQFQLYLLDIKLLKITKFLKIAHKFSVNKGKTRLLECHLIERQQYEGIPC